MTPKTSWAGARTRLSGVSSDLPLRGQFTRSSGVSSEQLLRVIVKRFRGGLVFKARGLLYHSTLDLRLITGMLHDPEDLMGWGSHSALGGKF